ncbi:MAG: protein phosphatase 2C domain-containing protein [Actinobacteria bacterium]|nr:protein phosphatase 2C domain-containing protein [Actinomycetota bacterium]
MSSAFSIAARSVTGLVRSGNEDSALLHSHLVAVADGMGGHVGGEIASSLAIKVIGRLAPLVASVDVDSVEDLLLNSLDSVNEEIARVVEEDSDLAGMGTTLTTLALYSVKQKDYVAILHVGDSRCYRLRGATLTQLSHDHTVLQELLDQGKVSAEEAQDHPQKSFLTQALMGEDRNTPMLTVFEVKENDRFLLCSDGLCGVVSEKTIKEGLKITNKDEALSFLIDSAFSQGAPDNVTVIVADIGSGVDEVPATYLGAALHE